MNPEGLPDLGDAELRPRSKVRTSMDGALLSIETYEELLEKREAATPDDLIEINVLFEHVEEREGEKGPPLKLVLVPKRHSLHRQTFVGVEEVTAEEWEIHRSHRESPRPTGIAAFLGGGA